MQNQQKIIVGLDLDGVIIDHTDLKIRFSEKLGRKLKEKETPADIMRDILPLTMRTTIKEAIYDGPETATSQPLISGAQEGIEHMQASEIPFYIISRRKSEKSRENAIELLQKHSLWPRYFSQDNVFFVDTKEEKTIKAKELGITHYIDDQIRVLDVLDDVENKFLLDSFDVYNDSKDYVRVSSWSEFMKNILL